MSNYHVIMSSSYYAVSLIKKSDMSKEQLAIFLLNISKEALCDFLIESGILNKPTNLTKNKMIELIINDGILTTGNVQLTYLQIMQKN